MQLLSSASPWWFILILSSQQKWKQLFLLVSYILEHQIRMKIKTQIFYTLKFHLVALFPVCFVCYWVPWSHLWDCNSCLPQKKTKDIINKEDTSPSPFFQCISEGVTWEESSFLLDSLSPCFAFSGNKERRPEGDSQRWLNLEFSTGSE